MTIDLKAYSISSIYKYGIKISKLSIDDLLIFINKMIMNN